MDKLCIFVKLREKYKPFCVGGGFGLGAMLLLANEEEKAEEDDEEGLLGVALVTGWEEEDGVDGGIPTPLKRLEEGLLDGLIHARCYLLSHSLLFHLFVLFV
jgi:hypothetical protein